MAHWNCRPGSLLGASSVSPRQLFGVAACLVEAMQAEAATLTGSLARQQLPPSLPRPAGVPHAHVVVPLLPVAAALPALLVASKRSARPQRSQPWP